VARRRLLKTLVWNDVVEVITVKQDTHYWPTYEIRRSNSGWVRLQPSAAAVSLARQR